MSRAKIAVTPVRMAHPTPGNRHSPNAGAPRVKTLATAMTWINCTQLQLSFNHSVSIQ
jgi:hypothetical protein